jgi:endonuclease III
MANVNAALPAALDLLEGAYGPPPEPDVRDPWDQVLLENVVYLASEDRRIEAFEQLRGRVGTAPSALLESPIDELGQATRLGIRADAQARKLQAAGRLALTHFGGDLGSRLAGMPLAEARRALRRFPAIGEPAADRILLQAGLHAVPALDSNGLRVLVRLGLAQDAPSYAASHRSATALLRDALSAERASLLRAYLLLRTHGRELCRRTAPVCAACPLVDRCVYARRSARRAPSR